MSRTPSRRNPLTFDNRIPLTPELRETIRASKARVAASAFSPAKHRAIEAATANSPHNFRVVIQPHYRTGDDDAWLAHRKGLWRDVVRPDAVTLVSTWDVRDVRAEAQQFRTEKAERGGVFTAFTYLHRLGDNIAPRLFLSSVFDKDELISTLGRGYMLDYTDSLKAAAQRADVARIVDMARDSHDLFHRVAEDIRHYDPHGESLLRRYVQTHVNSKMVREGYSAEIGQSLADLFPLCELTPASRPLFLPFDETRMAMPRPWAHTNWNKAYPAEVVAACSAWGAEMNVRFRALYNTLIPALYGTVWFI